MAGAFAQHLAGDRLDVVTGGSQPAEKINADMVKAMAEKGIDLAFRVPQSIDAALAWGQPEVIVTMGCGEQCPAVPGAQHQDWDLPDPADQPPEAMRAVRDDVEARVKLLIRTLSE
jgi:protein-tyrosine-phosphatase